MMWRRKQAGGVAVGVALLCQVGSAQDLPRTAGAIDPLYQDVASGSLFETVPPNTGPALTIDLGVAGRLTIPPRFAEQEIFEVQRLLYLGSGFDDVVAVGLHAYTKDGKGQAFALIYALKDHTGVLKAVLPLRMHFENFEILEINGAPVLAIHGESGMHFQDLWLYRLTSGQPELLLAQGSAAGVAIRADAKTGNLQVWVGVENWADPDWNYATGKRRWNVYAWAGDGFKFSEALSTTRETTASERNQGFVACVKEDMKH